jgi:vitamin B12 transporter
MKGLIAMRFPISIAVALACGPSIARAQEPPDTFRLDQIVVTATGVPAPRAAVPAAVSVIRGEELRRRGVRYVADALRDVPGLAVSRNGSVGGLTSVFVRGGESDYVQVLVDGVQYNDPGGAFDFSSLTTDDIERIEIVRGPVSVLYGSDAVTGVIQIFTRRGHGRPRIEVSAGTGRSARVGPEATGGFGSYDAAITLSGTASIVSYAFSASRHTTDGAWAYNNAWTNTTLGSHLSLRPDARTDATVTARWTDGTFHYPTNGAGALIDRNQFSTNKSLSLGLEAGHTFRPWIEARLAVATRGGNNLIDDRPDDAADTLGGYALRVADDIRRSTIQTFFNLRPVESVTWTIGGEAEWQSARNGTSSESSFGPYESASDNDRSNRALYSQLLATPLEGLHLTAGGRIDDNDRFGAFRTYRIGLNVEPARHLVVRAAAGTGFKEPTFYENYAEGFVRGNAELQPERTRNVEIGAEIGLLGDRLEVGATVYRQRFRNLIQFTYSPADPADPNYFNIGEVEANGAEFTARWSDASGFSAAASAEALHTEVLDEGFGADRLFIAGQPLVRRPKQRFTLSAGWTARRWDAAAVVARVGRRDDLDFSDPSDFSGRRVTLDPYTTLGLSTRISILEAGTGHSLDLTLRIDNVLDAQYEEIVNFPSLRRSLNFGLRTTIGG